MILNTVAAPHNLDAFTSLLKRDGTMALVGAPSTPIPRPRCSIWCSSAGPSPVR